MFHVDLFQVITGFLGRGLLHLARWFLLGLLHTSLLSSFGTKSGDAPHPFCTGIKPVVSIKSLPGATPSQFPRQSQKASNRRLFGDQNSWPIPTPTPGRDRRSWLEKHPCTDPFSGRFWLTWSPKRVKRTERSRAEFDFLSDEPHAFQPMSPDGRQWCKRHRLGLSESIFPDRVFYRHGSTSITSPKAFSAATGRMKPCC